MEEVSRVTPRLEWPGLYNLTLFRPNPILENLQGRPGLIRGTDPVPPQTPEDDGSGWDIPILPGWMDNPIESGMNKVMKNALISIAGLLLLAVGLVALVLNRGGSTNAG